MYHFMRVTAGNRVHAVYATPPRQQSCFVLPDLGAYAVGDLFPGYGHVLATATLEEGRTVRLSPFPGKDVTALRAWLTEQGHTIL